MLHSRRRSSALIDLDMTAAGMESASDRATQAPMASTSYQHSQVEESIQSIHRRKGSASTGKTHFRLAPAIFGTAGPAAAAAAAAAATTSNTARQQTQLQQRTYDEAWARWMRQGGPSSGHESLYEVAPHNIAAVPTSPTLSQSSFYNTAWQRWMGLSDGTRKYAEHISAPAEAEAVSAAKATMPVFESVPRQATKPIMSRLPLAAHETADAEAADPTRAGGTGNLDYLEPHDGHAGVLDAPDNEVKYTRARLPVLDDDSLPLWHALHALRGVSDDYADGYGIVSKTGVSTPAAAQAPHPIAEGMDASQCPAFAASDSTAAQASLALVKRLFNWDELPDMPADLEYTWYGVAFRSKRKAGSESMNFYEADRRSHEEAVDCGGLLMYWYGLPNATTGHNLATCIWTSREDAKRASALPLHARAAAHAGKAYESFELSRYAVRKVKGETRLRLEEWTE